MPKIPMVNRPQLGQHEDSTAPLHGAPGLNWRIDGGLQQLGNALTRGAGAIGDSLLRGVDASVALAAEKQRADDADNMAELELLANTRYGELDSKLREDPASYEKFGDYQQLTTHHLNEEASPLLSKMSTRARQEGELYLRKREATATKFTRDIAFQADITMKRGSYDMRIRQYAKNGDTEQARKQLNQAIDTGIFNANEQETYGNFINELADFGAVERRIEADDLAILDDLKKQGEGGAPSAYANLSSSDRRQLIRYAEQKKARREVEQTDAFVADVLAGKSITEESVLQRDDITQGTKNDFIKILRGVQGQKERQQTAAEKEKERQRTAAEKEKAAEHTKERQYARDAMAFEMMEFQFSADPVERDKQYAAFNRRIYTEFAKDNPAYAKALKTQLNEVRKAAEKPESSYKKSYTYVYGDNKLAAMKDDFHATTGRYGFWRNVGGLGIWTKNFFDPIPSKDSKADNFAMAKITFDAFMKANPQASPADVDTFLDKLKRDTNWAECDKLMQYWGSYPIPNASRKINTGEIERNAGGKIAIFDNNKKFLRWKDEE